YRKKLTGSLAGAEAADVPARKQAFEAATRAWAAETGTDSVARAIDILDAAAPEREAIQLYTLRRSALERAQLLQSARTLYRWAKEREKPDAARAAGFRNVDRRLVADRLTRVQSRFHPSVDRALFERALDEYRKLPTAERSAPFEAMLTA